MSPRTAQAAMRHSRIDLTMNVYTDPTLLDVAGAVVSLPNIKPLAFNTMKMQATGTNGKLPPELPPASDSIGQKIAFLSLFGTTEGEGSKAVESRKNPAFRQEIQGFVEGGRRGSNPRPSEPQSDALTN